MIAALATSWVVVLEVDGEDPAETVLEAFGPFAGHEARENAQRFCGRESQRSDVYSAVVLPMRAAPADAQPILLQGGAR